MANHQSAKKAARKAVKNNLKNNSVKNKLRTIIKNFLTSVSSGNKAEAEKNFIQAQSQIAKAAKSGVVNKLAASRKISRLSKKLKEEGTKAQVVSKATAKKPSNKKSTGKVKKAS